jgi:hypothetical protein
MNNITEKFYTGKWKGTNPYGLFQNNEGKIDMLINKYKSLHIFNLIPNIERLDILYFQFEIKDGNYKDIFMDFNFTLKFPNNFHKNFEKENSNTNTNSNINKTLLKNPYEKFNLKNNSIIIKQENVNIHYYIGQFFEKINTTMCNESTVEIEFIRDPIFHFENFDDINSIEYSKLKGKIYDNNCKFNYDFTMEVEFESV